MRIFSGPDGKMYQQEKKRSRRSYKTPAKIRKKMAAAARRAKFPLLTMAAVGLPVFYSVGQAGGFNQLFSRRGGFNFLRYMLASYTGVMIYDGGTARFEPQRMLFGLVPAAAVFGINKTGILKPVNQKLAKMKIPLRIS